MCLIVFSSSAPEGDGDVEMMSASYMSQFTQSLLLFVRIIISSHLQLITDPLTPVSNSIRAKIYTTPDSFLQQSATYGTHEAHP